MEEVKLTGMRDLNSSEIRAMNKVAKAGNGLGDLLDEIEIMDGIRADQRWLDISRTHL